MLPYRPCCGKATALTPRSAAVECLQAIPKGAHAITRQTAAQKLCDYLHHKISAAQLTD